MQELPVEDKAPHSEVHYERTSEHAGESCSNCQSLIDAADEPRCKTVESPIYLAGWCVRWPGKK